ncbi:Protein TTE1956 [Pseudolycoriella hygida]|uniref:Protein TTE1956 n=1 Tax=Pseudolycoriella hygida TaxID=35572 RepID=A0A9Q0RY35_9DIPT|nr:Protein TTE1956 [Pseudolycoriella hygida]
MPIVGGFVFPHGAITLDPNTRDFNVVPAVKPTSKQDSINLHSAMAKNAESLVNLRPDLIIFSTPHGLRLKNSFLFLSNLKAKGSAEWDGDWTEFIAGFNIDVDSSNSLVTHLVGTQTPKETLPLRWGEVIPWWFINNAAENAGFQLPPVIYIGQPSKRSQEGMIPELLKLGKNIYQWTESNENVASKNIVVVISSDLSHYHSDDPTSPYAFNEVATVFDEYIKQWAEIDMNSSNNQTSYDKLITKAGGCVDPAGSCGYTGLVTLHGILDEAVHRGSNFKAEVLDYSAPTYYGMMVNNFINSS